MKHPMFRQICAAAVLLTAAASAQAQATIYTANVAGPYPTVIDFTAPCGAGPCQNYSLAMTPSVSFTTSAPLAANLTNANVIGSILSYSFADGINTYDSSDSNARIRYFLISTDGTGAITSEAILVQRWLTGAAPHGNGDRYSNMRVSADIDATHNTLCAAVGATVESSPDTCFAENLGFSRSQAGNAVFTWSSAAAPISATSIPTMSEWGLILMAALVGLGSFAALRYKPE